MDSKTLFEKFTKIVNNSSLMGDSEGRKLVVNYGGALKLYVEAN